MVSWAVRGCPRQTTARQPRPPATAPMTAVSRGTARAGTAWAARPTCTSSSEGPDGEDQDGQDAAVGDGDVQAVVRRAHAVTRVPPGAMVQPVSRCGWASRPVALAAEQTSAAITEWPSGGSARRSTGRGRPVAGGPGGAGARHGGGGRARRRAARRGSPLPPSPRRRRRSDRREPSS